MQPIHRRTGVNTLLAWDVPKREKYKSFQTLRRYTLEPPIGVMLDTADSAEPRAVDCKRRSDRTYRSYARYCRGADHRSEIPRIGIRRRSGAQGN